MDVHPLANGRPLVLAGVTVDSERGPEGHSDADALSHAVIDALLGAAGLGDIGTHFPSSNDEYRGTAGAELVDRTLDLLEGSGWRVEYVDATIVLERPRLSPFIAQIRRGLAASLKTETRNVNIKATTTDGLGTIGQGEGIAALAVATLVATQ